MESLDSHHMTRGRLALVAAGPLLALAIFALLGGSDLSWNARVVAGVGAWVALWWMTEAAPLEITGVLPLVVFPTLKVVEPGVAAAPYANPVIFLLLGGTLMATAMERSRLEMRLALLLLSAASARPRALVGGFLAVASFLSMWVSNTATTAMLLPITLSVATVVEAARPDRPLDNRRFGAALMMAIAAGSSIGGVGTLVGTPPTAQFAAFMRDKMQITVTFLEWMLIGVPIIAVFVPVTWIVLTRVAFKVDNELIESVGDVIRTQRAALGPMNAHQSRTLGVFLLTVAAWVTSAYTGLNDSIIAMMAVVLLCLIPSSGIGSAPLLTWKAASKAPWGIWLLFGGGLCLAEAIDRTGLAKAISAQASGMEGAPVLLVMFVFAAAAVMLTELSNNTALVAMGLPIAQAVSASFGIPPQVLMVTIVLTASLGFMLPSGTAANALVFQTGRISVKEMARAGLLLDLLSAIMVPLVVYGFWKMGVLPGLERS